MKILFEEHAGPQRAGGVEAATAGLVAALVGQGMTVIRRFPDSPEAGGPLPSCVHVHGIWSPSLMRRMTHWRKCGVPCMVTVHGMLEPWAFAHKKWKKRVAWHLYQKRLLNQASALHATSEREAANLRKLGLKPPILMIPWGIEGPKRPNVELGMLNDELEDSNQRTEDRGQRSADSIIQNSKFKIQNLPTRTALFVGRIYPVKGLPLLVDAWARIRPAGWKIKIVGPDEAGHLAEVEALVRKSGLEDAFEFTGALEGDDLRSAYQSADLLIAPSHTENFGMAIAEAMSHRLPVITTHGAPWKLLEEEHCGWWVPVSVDGIATALDVATRRSPEELSAMGERGRAVVAERFAWDGIAKQFVECYRWILGEGEKPGCVR